MNNPDNAIEVRDVKKRFKVYYDKGKSLKERVLFRSRNRYEERWVLNGVSFEVKKGEAIGLIGKNGCGKSTTLKMLTRIMYPTEGSIEIKGRVSSLIELGAGFHPDMSGRENIYTNASIFGLSHDEIDRRLDDIIKFSELEEFIDNPVRTYSSGMYMRLAFAVAINVDADVLLIDEILAVGDVSFQAKCFERLKEIKAKGTTIVIVSHVMGQIEQICDRAIWIEEGLIREEGRPDLIGKHYLETMEEKRMQKLEAEFQEELKKRKEQQEKDAEEQKREEEEHQKRLKEEEERKEMQKLLPAFCYKGATQKGNMKIKIKDAHISNSQNMETLMFGTGEQIQLSVDYESTDEAVGDSIDISVGITRDDGLYCFGTTAMSGFGDSVFLAEKRGNVKLWLDSCLQQGRYFIDIAVQSRDGEFYHYIYSALEIRVRRDDERQVGIFTMARTWEIGEKKYSIGQ